MARVIIGLMIIFMAIAPIAHGYLAFKYNAVQTLSPEEETHDEKPQGKEKPEIKDQYLHIVSEFQYAAAHTGDNNHLHQLIILSKGYAGIPLMPPDMH
jgi:hypothetical protein